MLRKATALYVLCSLAHRTAAGGELQASACHALQHSSGQQQGLRNGETAAALGLLLPGQLRQAASSSTAAQAAVTAAQGAEARKHAAQQAPGAGTATGAPAAHTAALREDVWPPLHAPVDPGAAELAARFVQEQARSAAEPANAGSAPGPASASCTGAAEAGQHAGGAAGTLDPGTGGGAAAGSLSALAALQGRLKQAGQSKGGTKARPHSYSAAKARLNTSVAGRLFAICPAGFCPLSARFLPSHAG